MALAPGAPTDLEPITDWVSRSQSIHLPSMVHFVLSSLGARAYSDECQCSEFECPQWVETDLCPLRVMV
jgi:hypothetical protein